MKILKDRVTVKMLVMKI